MIPNHPPLFFLVFCDSAKVWSFMLGNEAGRLKRICLVTSERPKSKLALTAFLCLLSTTPSSTHTHTALCPSCEWIAKTLIGYTVGGILVFRPNVDLSKFLLKQVRFQELKPKCDLAPQIWLLCSVTWRVYHIWYSSVSKILMPCLNPVLVTEQWQKSSKEVTGKRPS